MSIPARPSCPDCNDTGWKDSSDQRGVIRCECVTRRIEAKRLELARVPERYRHCTLGNFEVREEHPCLESQVAARVAVCAFIDHAQTVNGDGLLLIGPVGIGKTHLAVSIINQLLTIAPRLRCLFRDYRELLADIRDSYNPEVAATERRLLAPVFDADVLVIDELGAERATDWSLDTVSRILNTRYNRCRATILTTNYPNLPPTREDSVFPTRRASRQETLGDRISEPMRSRLHEMCRVVEIQGDDFRSTQRQGEILGRMQI